MVLRSTSSSRSNSSSLASIAHPASGKLATAPPSGAARVTPADRLLGRMRRPDLARTRPLTVWVSAHVMTAWHPVSRDFLGLGGCNQDLDYLITPPLTCGFVRWR